MEIQCRCGSWDTHPIRDCKTSHETGYFRCLACKLKFTPRDTSPTATVDLSERIEVLEVERKRLTGRLTAVSLPREMIDYAEHLEREAEKIFDRAQAVRKALADDTANVSGLLGELQSVELEIVACRYCQQAKIKPTKGSLREIIETYLQGRK